MKIKAIILLLFTVASFKSKAQINGMPGSTSMPAGITSSATPVCDSIYSFPVVDTWPTGVTWDGTHLWSAGSDLDFIFKYDTTGNIIDSLPSPSNSFGTQGLVFDGVNLWTLSEQLDKLFKLDINDGSIINQYDVPFNEDGWGLAYNGEYLYATNYTDSILAQISLADGQILNSYKTEHPLLGIEFINGTLYGLSKDFMTLHKINVSDGTFIESITWCIPYPLGMAWDGTHLWNISSRISSGGNQRLYKLDVSSFRTTSTKDFYPQKDIGLKVFPNPIIASGTIQVNANKSEFINIDLFNSYGQKIKTIMTKNVLPGETNFEFDSEGLSPGVYFLKLSSRNYNDTYKFVVSTD